MPKYLITVTMDAPAVAKLLRMREEVGESTTTNVDLLRIAARQLEKAAERAEAEGKILMSETVGLDVTVDVAFG